MVKRFRDALAAGRASEQIFDPWLMESTPHASATGNRQEDKNEKLHATHLHLTVREPKIL